MARLRYNLVQGTLAEDLGIGASTITLVSPLQEGGVDIPDVIADDILAIRIDSEIMHITAYTSGSTTATVLRGQESTVEADHFAGAAVRHVFTKEDVGGGGGGGGMTLVVATTNIDGPSPAYALERADFVCDGTADDVEIQAAVDLLGPVGGRIVLAQGLYALADSVNISAPVHIQGDPSPTGTVTFQTSETYIWRSGDFPAFTITSPWDGVLFLEDIAIEDDWAVPTNEPLLGYSGGSYGTACWMLERTTIYNWQYYGGGALIFSSQADYNEVIMRDCDIEVGEGSIINTNGKKWSIRAEDSYFSSEGQAFVILDTSLRGEMFFERCEIDGFVSPGLHIQGWERVDLKDCNVGGGVHLDEGEDFQIVGCLMKDYYGSSVPSGLKVSNASRGVISQLVSGGDTPCTHLIHLDTVDNCIISDSVLLGDPVDDDTYSGILLEDTTNCEVRGVQIRSNVTNKFHYGVRVEGAASENNLVEGNDLIGSCKTNGNEFSDAGTNTRGWHTMELSYLSGVVTTGTGAKRNRFDRPSVIGHTLLDVNTAPAGSSLIADVHCDGTTIYTTQANRPTISDAANQGISSALPDVKYVDTGSYLTVDVDQVGSSTPGSDLVVYQRYMPL